MVLEKLSEKQRKTLGIIGIVLVLGSWSLPVLAKVYFDISSITVGLWLTAFWASIWILNKIRKRYY